MVGAGWSRLVPRRSSRGIDPAVPPEGEEEKSDRITNLSVCLSVFFRLSVLFNLVCFFLQTLPHSPCP